MKKQTIWLSYDLGVKGDYPGLYKLLDTYKAKECGNSIAYFHFKYKNDLIKELTDLIKENVDIKNSDRFYVIFKKTNNVDSKVAGRFIIGNRKSSPWEGYAPTEDDSFDE